MPVFRAALRMRGGCPVNGVDERRPVDLAAVQADDVVLDDLSAALYGDDALLAAVLLVWRRDVESEPVPALVLTAAPRCSVLARIRTAVRGFFKSLVGGNR